MNHLEMTLDDFEWPSNYFKLNLGPIYEEIKQKMKIVEKQSLVKFIYIWFKPKIIFFGQIWK